MRCSLRLFVDLLLRNLLKFHIKKKSSSYVTSPSNTINRKVYVNVYLFLCRSFGQKLLASYKQEQSDPSVKVHLQNESTPRFSCAVNWDRYNEDQSGKCLRFCIFDYVVVSMRSTTKQRQSMDRETLHLQQKKTISRLCHHLGCQNSSPKKHLWRMWVDNKEWSRKV